MKCSAPGSGEGDTGSIGAPAVLSTRARFPLAILPAFCGGITLATCAVVSLPKSVTMVLVAGGKSTEVDPAALDSDIRSIHIAGVECVPGVLEQPLAAADGVLGIEDDDL